MAWWMHRERMQRRGKLAARRRLSGLLVLFLPLFLVVADEVTPLFMDDGKAQ